MAKVIKEEVRDQDSYQLIEPKVIECVCGSHLQLWSSWANECDRCHTEFNGSGQRLADRSQWGEETGEISVELGLSDSGDFIFVQR